MPSAEPSSQPSVGPTGQPSLAPSGEPSNRPSSIPSSEPTSVPSSEPSGEPSTIPSGEPSSQPSSIPTGFPISAPSQKPTGQPTNIPSSKPSNQPSSEPSSLPSTSPSGSPSADPTGYPSGEPSGQPSGFPTSPTGQPSGQPTEQPSAQPSGQPSSLPSSSPTSPSGQPTGEPSSQPTMTFAPSAVPTTSPPTSNPTGVENVFICVGANISMGTLESVFLYDLTSERAIREGIAQSTGIPLADVTYDKDVSLLCPKESEDNGGDSLTEEFSSESIAKSESGQQRLLAQGTSLNFAIRKALRHPTYEYTVDELTSELENRISNAIDTGAFTLDLLEAVEIYNATLLQTNDFKIVIAQPVLSTFFKRVVQHFFSPTSAPSSMPSIEVSEQSTLVTSTQLTVGASAFGGLLLLICICCFVFCACKRDKKKRVAIYAVDDEDSIPKSEEAKEEGDRLARLASRALQPRKESKDSSVSALSIPGVFISMNRCFLYVKPHANRESVRSLVTDFLTVKNFKIVAQGEISAEVLMECADKQYEDLGKKALVLAPHECSLSSISMMAFEQKFRISWSVAVKKRLVQNARESCNILGVSHEELRTAWTDCIRHNKIVKLGRDFYCGYIDTILNKPAVFCINGFYMSVRAEYAAPDASVHYYCVEWDNVVSSWKDFRKKIVGSDDPSCAHPESLRATIYSDWKELGLAAPLDMASNGIHCSASAFEALVEISEWLKLSVENDRFGDELIRSGVSRDMLVDWMSNISVKGKPVFDHMEDKGSRECVDTAKQLLQVSFNRAASLNAQSVSTAPQKVIQKEFDISESSMLSFTTKAESSAMLKGTLHPNTTPPPTNLPAAGPSGPPRLAPLDTQPLRVKPLSPLNLRRSDSLLSRASTLYGDRLRGHDNLGEINEEKLAPNAPTEKYFSNDNLTTSSVLSKRAKDRTAVGGEPAGSTLSPDSRSGHGHSAKKSQSNRKSNRKLSKLSPSPSKTFSI